MHQHARLAVHVAVPKLANLDRVKLDFRIPAELLLQILRHRARSGSTPKSKLAIGHIEGVECFYKIMKAFPRLEKSDKADPEHGFLERRLRKYRHVDRRAGNHNSL